MIYLSSLFKTEHPRLSERLINVIGRSKDEVICIQDTADIWCKDYLPIQRHDGKLVQFKYDPPYLKKYPKLKTNQEVFQAQLPSNPIQLDLVVDGGNLVLLGKKAIMTSAIYNWNTGLEDDEISTLIKKALDLDSLIVIPPYPDDEFEHADGVVRWLNDRTVFYNEDHTAYSMELKEVLISNGLECIPVPGVDVNTTTNGISAVGNYINCLETDSLILVPQYDLEYDEQALAAFMDNSDKDVLTLDSKLIKDTVKLAKKGGVFGCISTYYLE